MSDLDKEYEASLKSIETENKIDRIFYRPIGFRIARMLRGTGITPNMVTVVSIFVGAAVGFFFYHDDLIYNVCGILLLVCANILDCVDGQLARLTGIKSAIGRILDGFAGDIWFTCIYVGFALRLSHDYGTDCSLPWRFFPVCHIWYRRISRTITRHFICISSARIKVRSSSRWNRYVPAIRK